MGTPPGVNKSADNRSDKNPEKRGERKAERSPDKSLEVSREMFRGVTPEGVSNGMGGTDGRLREGKRLLHGTEGEEETRAVLVAGSSNRELAEKIANNLGVALAAVKLSRFSDGEISLQFLESLRGKDVYIVQPTSPPVNEHLMELLLMISTARRSSAKKITAVVPYYGYARQDRKLSSRVPISAADVAKMIEAMGVDRVIAVDLHCGQIQGFFSPKVPVDNLEAQRVALEYFKNKGLKNVVVISPDAGGVQRSRIFQEGLIHVTGDKTTRLAMIIKQRREANRVDNMELVGSVDGAVVIIVDDMIDTAGTLCEAARQLKAHGAVKIFCFATHGLFSGPAIDRLMKSELEEVVVTDSIKTTERVAACPKITQLSISRLLADAVYHCHRRESLQSIFNPINREKLASNLHRSSTNSSTGKA